MTRFMASLAAVGLLAAGSAFAQTGAASPATPSTGALTGTSAAVPAEIQGAYGQLDQKDRTFVRQAAEGNQAEIEAARLAMQKAQTPAVKEFARWMMTDHTLAGKLMQTALEGTGFTPPSQPNATQRQQLQQLRGVSGNQFDHQYITGQVQDHQKMVGLFQQASQDAINPQVRELATQLLPVLHQHLDEAQALEGNMTNNVATADHLNGNH